MLYNWCFSPLLKQEPSVMSSSALHEFKVGLIQILQDVYAFPV